jgi:hypothetical protein
MIDFFIIAVYIRIVNSVVQMRRCQHSFEIVRSISHRTNRRDNKSYDTCRAMLTVVINLFV